MDNFGAPDDLGEAAGEITGAVASGLKKIGQAAISQITGKVSDTPDADEISKMKKNDEEFSGQAQEEIRARINAIYAQHAAQRKRQEAMQKQEEKKVEVQKEEIQKEQKREKMDVTVAQTKANAEIKNMGAE